MFDEVPPAALLPAESNSHGVTGSIDGQAVSTTLARQYLASAEAVTETLDVSDALACRGDVTPCVREYVEQVATQVYRRPVLPDELTRLMTLYATLRADGSAIDAVRGVVQALLTSPQFLYLMTPSGTALDDTFAWTVAARLSYFIWDTMPDAELREAAASGGLTSIEQTRAQARRLLADPRAKPMLHRFYSALLRIDQLETVPKDATLKFGNAERTRLRDSFNAHVDRLHSDPKSTFADLLTSPVAVDDPAYPADAVGLVGHPAVMATHAGSETSDPIGRGVVVLENILCQKLPPPPPGVDIVPPKPKAGATTRELFAAHVADPTCAGCHQKIDGIGFGFEAYDAIGRRRSHEYGRTIDNAGVILGTSSVNGPFHGASELSARLARSRDARDCFASQWLSYALGRRLNDTQPDRTLRAHIAERFRLLDANLQALIIELATSSAVQFAELEQP